MNFPVHGVVKFRNRKKNSIIWDPPNFVFFRGWDAVISMVLCCTWIWFITYEDYHSQSLTSWYSTIPRPKYAHWCAHLWADSGPLRAPGRPWSVADSWLGRRGSEASISPCGMAHFLAERGVFWVYAFGTNLGASLDLGHVRFMDLDIWFPLFSRPQFCHTFCMGFCNAKYYFDCALALNERVIDVDHLSYFVDAVCMVNRLVLALGVLRSHWQFWSMLAIYFPNNLVAPTYDFQYLQFWHCDGPPIPFTIPLAHRRVRSALTILVSRLLWLQLLFGVMSCIDYIHCDPFLYFSGRGS